MIELTAEKDYSRIHTDFKLLKKKTEDILNFYCNFQGTF